MDKKIDNLYRNDKTDEAIHQLIEKIDEHPKNVDNYLQLSTYLIEQGSFDQAQKLLEQAQHLVEKPQELSYNLAVAYYMQGEFDKALTLLDKIPNFVSKSFSIFKIRSITKGFSICFID